MRVLYINDDPVEFRLADAFRKAGIKPEIMVVKTVEKAREYLSESHTFDVVFMDYDMGRNNTVDTGLVRAFVSAGFKKIVANSNYSGSNDRLIEAGCTHICEPCDFEYLVQEIFGGKT